jgi:predicted nucleic acid-binding protein
MALSGQRESAGRSASNTFQRFWPRLPVIPYTEQTAYEHARVWAELGSAGKMIGYYDIVTALERGSKVATFNLRHFAQVKGLAVIEPR